MRTLNLLLTMTFSLFFVGSSFGVTGPTNNWLEKYQDNAEINSLPADAVQRSLDQFLHLTPKKYKKSTGKNLGLKNTLKLKAAQRMIKKNRAGGEDLSSGLYVLLAILGWGWLAIGLLDDWEGNTWITCLLLTFLCWLPGLIYALSKKKNYF